MAIDDDGRFFDYGTRNSLSEMYEERPRMDFAVEQDAGLPDSPQTPLTVGGDSYVPSLSTVDIPVNGAIRAPEPSDNRFADVADTAAVNDGACRISREFKT